MPTGETGSNVKGQRRWPLRLISLGVIAAALATILLVAVPWHAWHHPAVDARYVGLDTNLMYVDPRGEGSAPGLVRTAADSATLIALPSSQPSIQLVTTPLAFSFDFDVRVVNVQGAIEPVRICVGNQVTATAYCLIFGPPPERAIYVEKNGQNRTLLVNKVGNYLEGVTYHLQVARANVIKQVGVLLRGDDQGPISGNSLLLQGGRTRPTYGDVVSDYMPVRAGATYVYTAMVKPLTGYDAFKLNVSWFDGKKKYLGFANDWQSTQKLTGWTAEGFKAVAPKGARLAQVHLASGDYTQTLFAAVSMREESQPSVELLKNGAFTNGRAGWLVLDKPNTSLEIIQPRPTDIQLVETPSDFPDLFAYLRQYLSVSAQASTGTATTSLEHFTLVLPSQRWAAAKIDDPNGPLATIVLVAISALLALSALLLGLRRRWHTDWLARTRRRLATQLALPKGSLLLGTTALAAYFLLNGLLFQVGTMPFDMISQKVWAYVGVHSGVPDMYYRPLVSTSLAPIWNGLPRNEPGFEYGAVTAYYYAVVGWIYQAFLVGREGFQVNSFSLEFLIKAFNVLFGLADGILVYMILRRLGTSVNGALVSSSLLIFNPAVWFTMSIWGQIETVAIFFILVSLWLAEGGRALLAWVFLALAVLTKPQMVVIAPVIAVVYLRRFPFWRTIVAAAWAVVVGFAIVAPLAIAISPSIPVDVVARVASVFGSGVDPSANSVGGDGYDIWPLITNLTAHQTGLARFGVPSTNQFLRGLSYDAVSNLLWIGLFAIVTILILGLRRIRAMPQGVFPLLALAMLGFLMFKTGMVSRYFIYALPLLILCRRSMPLALYYSIISVFTLTVFVSVYGAFTYETYSVPWAAPLLHIDHNAISRAIFNLYTSDWFISFAVLTNVLVLFVLLGAAAMAAIQTFRMRPVVA